VGGTDSEAELSEARRLFVATLPAPDQEVQLDRDAAQHARVLRLVPGALVTLFDGKGRTAAATVLALERGALRCRVTRLSQAVEPPPRVTLVLCLPKAGKLDDIVRMTTELGVSSIALAVSERCVARPSDREAHKLGRLERVAIEAARQAEQPYLPDITSPGPLAEVVARAPAGAFRAACLERSSTPLPRSLDADELWLAIGPEGGFSPRDREILQDARFVSVALGRSILRTETAAVVGVALARDRLGGRR
jgi:16S rRNA (uracil1498-N3)-methyltransferase